MTTPELLKSWDAARRRHDEALNAFRGAVQAGAAGHDDLSELLNALAKTRAEFDRIGNRLSEQLGLPNAA